MKITILGCHAATPRTITNPTAQHLEIKNRSFLIDCGEGTQVQIRKNKININKIKSVFISHLHGDHFYGLIGLISTMALLNRTTDLHVFAPKGAKEIIYLQLKLSESWTNYNLFFHELSSKNSELIFEDEKILVKTIPLKHRVYTNGFLFQEKTGERQLNIPAIEAHGIEKCYYQNIKKGKDVLLDNGKLIENKEITTEPKATMSYAFCSDTMYNEEIISIIKNVDILYHESTFLESEQNMAQKTMHSTAKEAATIAAKANVKNLILGHYSTRYKDLESFRDEAQTVFSNVLLAEAGKLFEF